MTHSLPLTMQCKIVLRPPFVPLPQFSESNRAEDSIWIAAFQEENWFPHTLADFLAAIWIGLLLKLIQFCRSKYQHYMSQYFFESIQSSQLKSKYVFCYIMNLIVGERYVYKFVCDPETLFQMALADSNARNRACHLAYLILFEFINLMLRRSQIPLRPDSDW